MSDTNLVTLTTREAATALQYGIMAGRPVFLWGQPGTAKSAMVAQTATVLDRHLMDGLRASQLDSVDVRGIPEAYGPDNDRRTRWLRPDFLPAMDCPPSIFFVDEFNRATVSVQNAFLQLCHERRLGDYHLPPQVAIVAAGNYESDGGGVQRLIAAQSNRWLHIDVQPNLDDWRLWASHHGIAPMVLAFLKFRPEHLYRFEPRDRAFPTLRTWEYLSDVVHTEPPASIALALYAGCVGYGVALEFLAFSEMYMRLPDINAIVLNPATAPLPSMNEISVMYAVTTALAHVATPENFGRVLTYLLRMPLDYVIAALQDALQKTPDLSHTPEFTKFASEHPDVW